MWDEVRTFIDEHDSFLVTTHIFPDGDAIGSELALARALRKLGKRALVVNEHPTPRTYEFLDPDGSIKTYTEDLDDRIARCTGAFVLDVGSLERLGNVGPALERAGPPTACIDHHKTNGGFADVNVIDPRAASTGELIYDLVRALDVPVTRGIADALFIATATDTGWFRFPNTSPRVHRMAADLIELGVEPARIYAAIHETDRWERMELVKRVLGTLEGAADGRIAYFYLTNAMLEETGATEEDAEELTDLPRPIEAVQLILFFRETRGKIKVSMRSKDGPPVDTLAGKYGGGGHARAAGILMEGELADVMNTIVDEAKALLDSGGR